MANYNAATPIPLRWIDNHDGSWSPNVNGQMYIWDVNTLSWKAWDGSLTTGAITIGTVNQGNAGAQMWKVDASGAVVPISVTALPLPTGAALEAGNLATIAGKDFATQATLALIKAKTDNLDVALSTRTKPADAQHVIVDSSAAIPVTGPLTDTQLRATPVPVSGTVSVTGSTVGIVGNVEVVNDVGNPLPVSATSLPLPSGASTEATLALIKADVDKIPSQGQATMAGSTPVAIASNQSNLPVTESRPATSTTTELDLTGINDANRNITMLALNANRRSARFVNRSNNNIPIREGAVASPTIFSWVLKAKGELVLDYPVCTAALNGHFGTLPDDRIFITERV